MPPYREYHYINQNQWSIVNGHLFLTNILFTFEFQVVKDSVITQGMLANLNGQAILWIKLKGIDNAGYKYILHVHFPAPTSQKFGRYSLVPMNIMCISKCERWDVYSCKFIWASFVISAPVFAMLVSHPSIYQICGSWNDLDIKCYPFPSVILS